MAGKALGHGRLVISRFDRCGMKISAAAGRALPRPGGAWPAANYMRCDAKRWMWVWAEDVMVARRKRTVRVVVWLW